MRVLQLLDGIGPGKARQAERYVQQEGQGAQGLLGWNAPAPACEAVDDLARMLNELAASPPMAVGAQIEQVRKFYGPLLEQWYDQPEIRLRDLDQLELLYDLLNDAKRILKAIKRHVKKDYVNKNFRRKWASPPIAGVEGDLLGALLWVL